MLPFFSLCKSSVNLQNMHQIADRVVVERGVILLFWIIEISIIPSFIMNYYVFNSLVEVKG